MHSDHLQCFILGFFIFWNLRFRFFWNFNFRKKNHKKRIPSFEKIAQQAHWKWQQVWRLERRKSSLEKTFFSLFSTKNNLRFVSMILSPKLNYWEFRNGCSTNHSKHVPSKYSEFRNSIRFSLEQILILIYKYNMF